MIARFFALLERLVVATETLATPQVMDPVYVKAVQDNTEIQRLAIEKRQAWEAIEKQHMAECARRFHADRSGDGEAEPVRH